MSDDLFHILYTNSAEGISIEVTPSSRDGVCLIVKDSLERVKFELPFNENGRLEDGIRKYTGDNFSTCSKSIETAREFKRIYDFPVKRLLEGRFKKEMAEFYSFPWDNAENN